MKRGKRGRGSVIGSQRRKTEVGDRETGPLIESKKDGKG